MAYDPSMESACPASTVFGIAMREEPATWYELIDKLEHESARSFRGDAWADRRKTPRVRHSSKTAIQFKSKMLMDRTNPWITFRAYTRNLSETGASLLLDSFTHAGTVCRVLIKTRDGKGMLVPGDVKFCKYVGHGMHEAGVAFRVALPLGEVLDMAELPTLAVVKEPGRSVE